MELWIGLAGLKANPNCTNFKRFGKGKGAYVHIATWADSRDAFEQRVKKAVEELDCHRLRSQGTLAHCGRESSRPIPNKCEAPSLYHQRRTKSSTLCSRLSLRGVTLSSTVIISLQLGDGRWYVRCADDPVT